MIHLKNISYQYPNSDFYLQIEELEIEKGQKTALIGPSGFGKTTMLYLIAGILLPQTGEVYIDHFLKLIKGHFPAYLAGVSVCF